MRRYGSRFRQIVEGAEVHVRGPAEHCAFLDAQESGRADVIPPQIGEVNIGHARLELNT